MSAYPGIRLRSSDWRYWITPVIRALVLANAAIFLLELILRLVGGPELEYGFWRWFGLVPWQFVHGMLWQPLSYLFLHAGFWHLLWNMLFLWMFGVDLERRWGARRFLVYYFLTGTGAGLVNVVVKMLMDPEGTGPALAVTVGASGAVYGVITAAAILFPDRPVWLLPFPITIPMKVYAVIMGAIEFFGTLGSGGDGVSHVTHLAAIFIGWWYLRRSSLLYRLRNRYADWKVRRARRRFEAYLRRHDSRPPSQHDGWLN